MSGNASGAICCEATYAVRIAEGDLAVPSLGVTSFTPATNFTKTVYVSVFRKNENGEEIRIATDAPHQEDCALIVTSGGGVVDARNKDDPWVDLNGTNHFSKRVGKSIKGDQSDFLLGCMEDQLGKLGDDVAALQKLFAGRKGDEEEITGMTEDVNKLRKTVNDLIKRPANMTV